ncbi:MAG: HRDC domain-containing protein [Kineosporiaceae bacterium]
MDEGGAPVVPAAQEDRAEDAPASTSEAVAAAVRRLDAPRDGVPAVADTPEALGQVVAAFAAGSGPVAVDAERASGHRYGQRAFLVQLRRHGAGTALVDPEALRDLSALGEALADAEWVLHAAGQDLPCLAEVGMVPRRVFDTELGGRLAGFPRVGLAAMTEQLLGVSLAKEHSAVDWSTRPLPEPWLRYAALDVEVLVDLRDAVEAELLRQDKLEWALEEFAAVAAAPAPAARQDPWRRTSGLHQVRTRRQLAVVRELWRTRDELARERDVSPGRVLPDAAIVAAALAQPADSAALAALPAFAGRGTRRWLPRWSAALAKAAALPDAALPPQHLPADGPPPPRLWPERDPAAAARLAVAREGLARISEERAVPLENLLSPDLVRRFTWAPPVTHDQGADAVATALRTAGARGWQVALVRDLMLQALAAGDAAAPA